MNNEEEFKETELGLLPINWRVAEMNEALNEVDLRFKDTEYIEKNTPVLSLTKNYGLVLQSTRFIHRVAIKNLSKYKVVKKGQIVYNPYVIWEGAIHSLKKFDKGVVSPAYLVWKNTNISNSEYMDFLLRTPMLIKEYEKFASGVVIRRRSIKKNLFQKIKIPFPPHPEQERIAFILSTVQNAKEKTQNLIKSLEELKKSTMKHLFTYGAVGFDRVTNAKLKETEIGTIPMNWEVFKLEDLGTFQYGYTESAKDKKIGPKFLRITDIDLNKSKIFWGSVPYCKIDNKELKKYLLGEGDILIARIGATTGKTCIVKSPPESVFASYLIRFKLNIEKLLPDFVHHFTNCEYYWKQINTNKEGKLKKGVSSSQLKKFKIPLPQFSEQQQIVDILSSIDEKIEAEEKRVSALEQLFKSLLHSLMSGKIRVKDLKMGVING